MQTYCSECVCMVGCVCVQYVCLCVGPCMYRCICKFNCVNMCISISGRYVSGYVCVYISMYLFLCMFFFYLYVYIHVYICECLCKWVWMCVCLILFVQQHMHSNVTNATNAVATSGSKFLCFFMLSKYCNLSFLHHVAQKT